MHIVFVSNYAPPGNGGIQFVMGQLANRYTADGHHVSIVAFDAKHDNHGWIHPDVCMIGVPAWNGLEAHSIPFPVFHPAALYRALNRVLQTADAVHIHGLLYMNTLLAAWMARRRGLRVVMTEHVGFVDYDRAWINAVERIALHSVGRFTLRMCNVVAVLNQRVHDEMRQLARRSTPIVKVVNGVDTTLFYPADAQTREALRRTLGFTRPTVLFVGRYAQKKGIDLALAAAAIDPSFDLVICGKDTDRIKSHTPNVRVIGFVDQPMLAQLYRAADVLLLPSTGEGFPLVVQEAMASGLPVVVSDDAVNREYLHDDAAMFTARDPDSIRQSLNALLADAARRAAMGASARAHALVRFDWAATAAQYLALYQR
jgi:glycosyltransferase involved in cell wall biosynthesis